MLNDGNERLNVYLDSVISSLYKLLCLFEEDNVGINTFMESFLFELYGLEKVFDLKDSKEYVRLLSILESLKEKIQNREISQKVVRREVFKGIDVVKKLKKVNDHE